MEKQKDSEGGTEVEREGGRKIDGKLDRRIARETERWKETDVKR